VPGPRLDDFDVRSAVDQQRRQVGAWDRGARGTRRTELTSVPC